MTQIALLLQKVTNLREYKTGVTLTMGPVTGGPLLNVLATSSIGYSS